LNLEKLGFVEGSDRGKPATYDRQLTSTAVDFL
jgi:hypothetical protein